VKPRLVATISYLELTGAGRREDPLAAIPRAERDPRLSKAESRHLEHSIPMEDWCVRASLCSARLAPLNSD